MNCAFNLFGGGKIQNFRIFLSKVLVHMLIFSPTTSRLSGDEVDSQDAPWLLFSFHLGAIGDDLRRLKNQSLKSVYCIAVKTFGGSC